MLIDVVDRPDPGDRGGALGDHRTPEFRNDALIALTARRHGATVVSANRDECMLLAKATGVRLLPA